MEYKIVQEYEDFFNCSCWKFP